MSEHDTDSLDCACGPDLYRPCPECNGERGGCWRCRDGDGADGLLRVTRDEAEWIDDPLVIVHQSDEDDEQC